MGLLLAPLAQGQYTNDTPYTKYSTIKKEMSVLEWKLLQVNLKLGESGYFVYLDAEHNLFTVDKLILTSTLETATPTILRELLSSESMLVSAVIGSEFQEFPMRGSKDLTITYKIGDLSRRRLATFSAGTFSFTEEYYSFRKEHDK